MKVVCNLLGHPCVIPETFGIDEELRCFCATRRVTNISSPEHPQHYVSRWRVAWGLWVSVWRERFV